MERAPPIEFRYRRSFAATTSIFRTARRRDPPADDKIGVDADPFALEMGLSRRHGLRALSRIAVDRIAIAPVAKSAGRPGARRLPGIA